MEVSHSERMTLLGLLGLGQEGDWMYLRTWII